MRKTTTIFFLLYLAISYCSYAQTGIRYPKTRRDSAASQQFFDVTIADPYWWMEYLLSPETNSWTAAQNKFTDSFLSQLPARIAIKKRFEDKWVKDYKERPFSKGRYSYFYKGTALYQQYKDDTPIVFFDREKFAKPTRLDHPYFSKDAEFVAFECTESGSDWKKVFVTDTRSRQAIHDTLIGVKSCMICWINDSGFFYVRYNGWLSPNIYYRQKVDQEVHYHKVGTAQATDIALSAYISGLSNRHRIRDCRISVDGNFIEFTEGNFEYSKNYPLFYKSLSGDNNPVICVSNSYKYTHDIVYAENGKLYMTTNAHAPNHKVIVADETNPKHWKTLIRETQFPLTSLTSCGHKLFAHYAEHGITKVYQYDLDGNLERAITLPGEGYAFGFEGKMGDTEVVYTYTSLAAPRTKFKYNIHTGMSKLYESSPINFDPSAFESKQVFYSSTDGVQIPMTIAYKKGTKLDGKNPLLLDGYGGFGISITQNFDMTLIPFMEQGGIFAVPNIRGGGEYGDKWHEDGSRMKKQNVFNDFIAAAEYLIKAQYTSSEYLAISGGSNGGLLVGACMTQRPDLFKVCIIKAGVLDMLYHGAAAHNREYGDPRSGKKMFRYMYSYSPLHNVRKECYPATLIIAGDNDDRVPPGHSYKFAAALQSSQSCSNAVLITIRKDEGHNSGSWGQEIDKWSFLFYNLKMQYK